MRAGAGAGLADDCIAVMPAKAGIQAPEDFHPRLLSEMNATSKRFVVHPYGNIRGLWQPD